MSLILSRHRVSEFGPFEKPEHVPSPAARPAREIAIVQPNERGGWSLILPASGKELGNYDSSDRAAHVAVLNGYDVRIHNTAPEAD